MYKHFVCGSKDILVPLPLEDDVTGLVDGSYVWSVTVLLRVDTSSHGGLTDDVESTVSDQGEDVKLFPSTSTGQDLTQLLTVSVHHLKEVLQNPAD